MNSIRPQKISELQQGILAAARSAESFVCVVRFATPKARNAFYAAPGQAGQGAEAQARSMLAELGITDVELATWVQPRAKVANAANAAAGAGAAEPAFEAWRRLALLFVGAFVGKGFTHAAACPAQGAPLPAGERCSVC